MRLFIGIPLPKDLQKRLNDEWRASTEKPVSIKETRPNTWHLTLAFLDNVPEYHVPQLCRLIRMAMDQPPHGKLYIDGFETFPRKEAAHVVGRICLADQKSWENFVTNLVDFVSLIAPNVDRKPWKPHITVGKKEKNVRLDHWSRDFTPIVWRAQDVALIHSTLTAEGSKYTILESFPLRERKPVM